MPKEGRSASISSTDRRSHGMAPRSSRAATLSISVSGYPFIKELSIVLMLLVRSRSKPRIAHAK